MDHMLFTNEISGQLQKERNNRIPDRTKDEEEPFLHNLWPTTSQWSAAGYDNLCPRPLLWGVIALRDDGEQSTDQSTRRALGEVGFESLKF